MWARRLHALRETGNTPARCRSRALHRSTGKLRPAPLAVRQLMLPQTNRGSGHAAHLRGRNARTSRSHARRVQGIQSSSLDFTCPPDSLHRIEATSMPCEAIRDRPPLGRAEMKHKDTKDAPRPPRTQERDRKRIPPKHDANRCQPPSFSGKRPLPRPLGALCD